MKTAWSMTLFLAASAALGQSTSNWTPLAVNTNTGAIKPAGILLAFSNSISYLDTAWDDLTFPAYGLGRAGNNDPDVVYNRGPGGDMIGVLFDAAADQEMFGKAQFRHSYKPGTAVRPHFHYSPTTAGTGSVVWAVAYSWAPISSNFPATATVTMTNAINTPGQWAHLLAGGVDIAAPPGAGESSIMLFRIYRDANNAGDTYPADVDLLDFDIHFQMDKIGTDDELPD
jgi:hypothetical protein